jgi:hypothetical protein
MRYCCYSKPKNCPKCKSKKIATILYGLPAFDEQLKKRLNDGSLRLGGCCVTDDDPEWECSKCGIEIYKKRKINKNK